MIRRWYPIATALGAALLAACGDGEGATSSTTASTAALARPTPTPAPMPATTPALMPATTPAPVPTVVGATSVAGSAPDPSLGDRDHAIADLRARVGATGEIDVVSHDEVTWSDGSLGCPQPGWSYTQALVNGTRIVLRHGGVLYEYHSGGRRRPFYCPPELVQPPAEQ